MMYSGMVYNTAQTVSEYHFLALINSWLIGADIVVSKCGSPSARCNHLLHALPASDHGANHAPEPVRVIDKPRGDHHFAGDAHGLGVSNDGLYFSQALANGVAGLRTTDVSLSFQGRIETASELV